MSNISKTVNLKKVQEKKKSYFLNVKRKRCFIFSIAHKIIELQVKNEKHNLLVFTSFYVCQISRKYVQGKMLRYTYVHRI